jgi:hypothetical protein
LINVKPCNDTVIDAQGNTVVCAWVGDLRVVMLDHRNHEYCVTLRGVRYSPHFQDTLISVDQLWFSSGIDSVFRDVRRLVFTKNLMADGNTLEVPFKRRDGMFKLAVGVCRETGSAAKLKSGIHAATSRSHIEMLPANERLPRCTAAFTCRSNTSRVCTRAPLTLQRISLKPLI